MTLLLHLSCVLDVLFSGFESLLDVISLLEHLGGDWGIDTKRSLVVHNDLGCLVQGFLFRLLMSFDHLLVFNQFLFLLELNLRLSAGLLLLTL